MSRSIIWGILLLAFLFSPSAKSDDEESDASPYSEISDDEDSKPLRTKSKASDRRIASEEDEELPVRTRGYLMPPSRFSFGLSAAQDFSVQSTSASNSEIDDSVPVSQSGSNRKHHSTESGQTSNQALDSDTSSSESQTRFNPIFTARVGYRILPRLTALANFSTDTVGIQDPTLGLGYLFPLFSDLRAIASLTASIPVSSASRSLSKITTLTTSLSTLLEQSGFFGGGGGSIGWSLYASSGNIEEGDTVPRTAVQTQSTTTDLATDTAADPLSSEERVRTSSFLFAGGVLTKGLSANLALGEGTIWSKDRILRWVSEATLARLAYGNSGFMAAVAFKVISDPAGTESLTFPDRPFVGFKLQYIFGAPSTVGIVDSEAVGSKD